MKVTIIGHRKIQKTEKLIKKLTKVITELVEKENADTFLFGSRSEFDNLCYDIVTELRYKHVYINRILVRDSYQYIDFHYTNYLLKYYEDTLYPPRVQGAGALCSILRNEVMIDMCDVMLTYYDVNYTPTTKTQSGTKLAVKYARRKRKRLINFFEKNR